MEDGGKLLGEIFVVPFLSYGPFRRPFRILGEFQAHPRLNVARARLAGVAAVPIGGGDRDGRFGWVKDYLQYRLIGQHGELSPTFMKDCNDAHAMHGYPIPWLVLFPGLAAMTMGQDSTTGAEVRTDVVYGHKDGMALTYDVFTPKSNAKGVGLLFMVSGGWVSTWAPPAQTSGIFRPMLDRGYTVIAIRHGSSPRYLVPDAVADVKLALQHVSDHAADYQIDPNKLASLDSAQVAIYRSS